MVDEGIAAETEQTLSNQLLDIKRTTGWSWERMSQEFHKVMGEGGPSHTTLFRFSTGKTKRRNAVVDRYVTEAISRTRIKQAERELQESESQRRDIEVSLRDKEAVLRTLMEAVPSVVVCLAEDGCIEEFNPEAERTYGCERVNVLGRNYFDLFLEDEVRQTVQAAVQKVWSGKPLRGFEHPITTVDGRKRILIWSMDLLESQHQQTRSVIASGQDITTRHLLENAVVTVLEGTSWTVGENFGRSLVKCLAQALEVKFAFLSKLWRADTSQVSLLAFWEGEGFGEVFEYKTEGTPCEQVFEHGLAFYPDGVQRFFPSDDWLTKNHIKSYLAVPIYDRLGAPIGHLGIMHDHPLHSDLPAESVLRAFAARAGAELERSATRVA